MLVRPLCELVALGIEYNYSKYFENIYELATFEVDVYIFFFFFFTTLMER